MQHVRVIDLGLIDYKEAWDYQEALFKKIVDAKINNRKAPQEQQTSTESYLLFCEHPHVYTIGNSGNIKHLLVSKQQLFEKKATFYETNRGGDITYHGPGQLVGYPILDLDNFFTDIHKYLRYLEESVILTLEEFGIKAARSKGETGVWIDPEMPLKARKICAMGVKASRWVTMHGFALNVNVDLNYFGNIIPCGIQNKAVTSMQQELHQTINLDEVKQKLKKHFCTLFQCELT